VTALTEPQERYVRALVEAWERADRETLRTLQDKLGAGSTTYVHEVLTGAAAAGYVSHLPCGKYMPTLLAIETYGTVWVRRERLRPKTTTITAGCNDVGDIAIEVFGTLVPLTESQALCYAGMIHAAVERSRELRAQQSQAVKQ
jgi:hypothetical protein